MRFLSLHYTEANSYFFDNGIDMFKLQAKKSEIVAISLFLGNISKGWTVDNMKKNRIK